MARTTLRELSGFDDTPAVLATATLVLVDYQYTYTKGVMELDGWRPALTAAAHLLAKARAAGAAVIHVVHDGGPGSVFDIRTQIGRIHPHVAPTEGEAVVVKKTPNAFVNTGLGPLVDEAGNNDLIVAGFMTNLCVAFTCEGAYLRGNRPTVVADACATRSLTTPVGPVAAEQIHRSALATIGDLFGVVVPSIADVG